MNIIYHISPSSVTENCTVKAYEPQLDGSLAEVGSIAKPAPHSSPTTITFTGLDRVTHVVKLIGDVSGIEYHFYDVAPTADIVTIFDPIFFKIGDGQPKTPLANTVNYVNTDLAGLTNSDVILYRNGLAQYPGVHYETDLTGGFHLIQTDDVFNDKDECIIQQKPKTIRTFVNDSVVGKQWGPTTLNANGYVDVSSAVSYTPAHLRKLIRLAGSSAVYTFSSGEVPPAYYPIRFTNYGAPGVTSPSPKIVFANAPAKYGSGTITELSIPFGTAGEVTWDGSIWNITFGMPVPVSLPTFHFGNAAVGDIIGEKIIDITIPNQGSTNYHISYSIISNGTAGNDNDVAVVFKKVSGTLFKAIFQETFAAAQNISLDYMIVKMP